MPKKATNIYKRKDGRWEARFLKSINADGKRIYGSVYGKTFDEAKAKQEKQFIIQKINDISDKNDCTKLSIVSLEWLNSIRLSTKVSTRIKYETIIYKHIKSHTIADRNVRLDVFSFIPFSLFTFKKITQIPKDYLQLEQMFV